MPCCPQRCARHLVKGHTTTTSFPCLPCVHMAQPMAQPSQWHAITCHSMCHALCHALCHAEW